MKKAEAVLKRVLDAITPTDAELKRTKEALGKIEKAARDVLKPLGLGYTLAGSFLRDTWLPDKKEFDIFVLFPESVTREKLEKQGLEIGKKIVKALGGSYEIAYAEHPYIRAVVGEYAVDFVPCYDIKEPGRIKSAVDRTPHHNRYILENLKGGLPSEVRLLKQFCKGIGVYGSDLCVEGFSGYLTELLIIRYGSFRNLLSEASKWEAGKVVLDLARHHRGKIEASKMFPQQPLVVIDPVDRKRNVAAALSPENFEKFKASCASFLKSPDERYFRAGKARMASRDLSRALSSRGTKLITVFFARPDVVDDVLYPQMRRSAKRLVGIMEDSGFSVIGSGVWCNDSECVLLFELEVWKLPPVRKVRGPPVFAKKHSSQFIKKYSGRGRIMVEGDSWVAEIKRKNIDAERLIKETLKQRKSALMGIGIASYVAGSMEKGFSALSDGKVAARVRRKDGFGLFLTEYFKNKVL
jgi:tRNA nucleotidyltransferase (CCA-adding enzyme)